MGVIINWLVYEIPCWVHAPACRHFIIKQLAQKTTSSMTVFLDCFVLKFWLSSTIIMFGLTCYISLLYFLFTNSWFSVTVLAVECNHMMLNLTRKNVGSLARVSARKC